MALSFSQFPFCPSKITSVRTTLPISPKFIPNSTTKRPTIFASRPLKIATITKASQEEDNNTTTITTNSEKVEIQPKKSRNQEITELAMEIKKAMKERGRKEEVGFLSGVVKEIREIEWPSFNKVLGTTGVVLGVIAGSSVVLLTVNAVFAEISDRVFAGKGVQDFFS